jgi:hypothetical protein
MVESLFIPGAFSNPTPAPAGTITSIFVRLSTAMVNRVYTDLTIKMAQSSITTFTTGTFYAGTLTTVYYRSSVTINNPVEWLEFILDTPFAYDPTQSLIVEMGQCGATGSGGSVRNTSTSGIVRVWSVGGCPFVPYNGGDAASLNFGITLGSVSGPPVVVTTAATAVTSAAATLNGTVNANGATTSVSFEYGLTTAYGTTVPGVPASVSGTTVTPVSAGITGLFPGTTYHYRVNGVNSVGTSNGGDLTFLTTSCPMPGPPGPVSGPVSGCGNTSGNI